VLEPTRGGADLVEPRGRGELRGLGEHALERAGGVLGSFDARRTFRVAQLDETRDQRIEVSSARCVGRYLAERGD